MCVREREREREREGGNGYPRTGLSERTRHITFGAALVQLQQGRGGSRVLRYLRNWDVRGLLRTAWCGAALTAAPCAGCARESARACVDARFSL